MMMTIRNLLSAVCTVCAVSAALVFLPSCEKEAPPPDTSNLGSMNITSTPSGAEVSFLGQIVGTTPRVTELMPSSMYIVKFDLDGYEPAWVPVNVVPGRQVDVHADLIPENAVVVIDSDPSGAHVQMDGKELGDAPVVLNSLPLGTYTASVQMQGFSRKDISWKVQNARPILITVPLMNNKGTLSLVSDPALVDLEIDGMAYGTTPFKDLLEQGQHRIRLVKNGYKTFEKIVTIKREEVSEVNVKLEMLPGSLEIKSEPTGAALFINDINYGTTPFKRDVIDAGTYRVRLDLEGYDSFEESVTVHPGEPTVWKFDLESNTGTVVMNVNPPGVNIYIDGKFVCRTQQDAKTKSHDVSAPVRIEHVAPGKHTVTITNKHAKPDVKTITVSVDKGKTTRVPSIELWLPDTTLILRNGSQYTGRLTDRYYETVGRDTGAVPNPNTKIAFRHSAGITSEYKMSEIREIVPLNITDGD